MNLKVTYIVAIFSILIQSQLFAQMTPEEAVAEMGRGINLGNTLDAPYEGDWALKAEEYYFDAYKEAGFTSVRIPITWHNHVETSSPYTVDPVFMDRVEEIVDWGLSRGLMIIINAHHEGWLKENYSPTNIARFESIWRQISDRFYEKSERLLFEPLNEPRTHNKSLTIAQAGDANQRALDIIREKNPTRNVIISGTGWSAIHDLLSAVFPKNDDYIIGYYHTYDPWEFSSAGNIKTWGSQDDKNYIANEFQKVKNWSDSNDIPVIMSEFGSVHETDFNSRMRHYATFVEQSLNRGISFMAWDDGGMFEIYQRSDKKWHETKDILIHYNEKTADNLRLELVEDSIVNLSWENRSESTEKIYIERKISDVYEVIDSVSYNTQGYNDTSLVFGSYHQYRIIQKDDNQDLISYPQRINVINTVRSYYEGAPIVIPGIVEVENYDIGGNQFTYSDNDDSNQGNAYRDDAVDIEAREDGGYHVGYLEVGEWLEYTVDVDESHKYKLTAEVAATSAGGKFTISNDINNNTTSFDIPSTNSWETTTMVSGDITLDEGIQILRIYIDKTPAFNIDRIKFEKKIEDEVVTSLESLEDELLSSILIGYPNPFTSKLNIEVKNLEGIHNDLQILDAIGNVILSQRLTEKSFQLNLEDLPNGMYFMKYSINGQGYCKKIIKR